MTNPSMIYTPHNIEAEKAVLGAILSDWSSLETVITTLSTEDFYVPQNKVVYSTMLELFKNGVVGDTVSIATYLREHNLTGQESGVTISYLTSLSDASFTSANIKYYADIVRNFSIRRELINISGDIKETAADVSKETSSVLEQVESRIFAITEKNATIDIQEMPSVVQNAFNLISSNISRGSDYTGIASGIDELDGMTSGFQNSEFTVIGARPSMGKTALAMSFMEHIAINNKIPCGFFSLEMSSSMIGQRLFSQAGRIPGFKLKSGHLRKDEMQKLQLTAEKCYGAPLFIVDQPNMKLVDLRAMARRMVSKFGVKIIFIDYIGLIGVENNKAPVYEQVSEVSKSLKNLARELDIPVVALCQVARDAEGEEPNLAQLRGSGSIEQDADVVMFIHRNRKKEDEHSAFMDAKIIVAKQRNGAIGDVKVSFFPDLTKFENPV